MFRMHFQGLITHAKLDDGWVAVVMEERQHAAILTVKNTDLIEATTPIPRDGPNVTCFDLLGRMKLENVQNGPVEARLQGVPSLRSICDGRRIRDEITYRRPSEFFTAYLDLEGGTLLVDDWFEHQVTFDSATLRCLPRTVLYATSATASSVVLWFDASNPDPAQRTFVRLQPTADVWFTNLDVSNARIEDEYATYRNFFYDSTAIQIPQEVETVDCAFGTPKPERETCREDGTLGVQCSNNQFP